ncbi:MAG: hypothetical protein FWB71_02895 [Defluviitaleaceae bacterium]|nr:hypothetical protein [Defluviitaleaceae bacterium]
MGMTDRQFDSYTQQQILVLRAILKEIRANGDSKVLEEYIESLERSLIRP